MKRTAAATSVRWDPAAYAASSAPQQTWALEMIARLALTGREDILDVGCGDGKVTAELARRAPRGYTAGIDSSTEMIRFAQREFPTRSFPNLHFKVMDARQITFNRQFDVVFSNAALHWVDDHSAFLRGAAECLRPGGRLVLSCGGKGNAHDVFLALRSQMRLSRWRSFFRKLERPYFFHSPGEYERWLPKYGLVPRRLRLAEKDMTWNGRDGLAAWLRTTWHPYLQRVPAHSREAFIDAVVNRYLADHPLDTFGRVHVQMIRLEIEAEKVGLRITIYD